MKFLAKIQLQKIFLNYSRCSNILKYLGHYKKIIIFLLLSSVFFLMGIILSGNFIFKDFFMSMFSNMLTLLVTLFLLNIYIERQKQLREFPVKFAIYNELRHILSRLEKLLGSMIVASSDRCFIHSEEIYSRESIDASLPFLAPEATVYSNSSITWPDFYKGEMTRVNEDIEKVLKIYISYMDPEIIGKIYNLKNSTLVGMYDFIYMDWLGKTGFFTKNTMLSYNILKETVDAIKNLKKYLTEASIDFKEIKGFFPLYKFINKSVGIDAWGRSRRRFIPKNLA